MNAAEFEEGLQELKDYYGENAFIPRAQALMYRVMGSLTRGEFFQVIQAVIEENARTPTVAALRKAAAPMIRIAVERKARAAIAQLEASGKSCNHCSLTGFVTAINRNDGNEYSFRCPFCQAATLRRHSYKIDVWAPDLADRYLVVTEKTHAAAMAFYPERREATILLAWLKRMREDYHAVARFERAKGTVPAFVIDKLKELGLLPAEQPQEVEW